MRIVDTLYSAASYDASTLANPDSSVFTELDTSLYPGYTYAFGILDVPTGAKCVQMYVRSTNATGTAPYFEGSFVPMLPGGIALGQTAAAYFVTSTYILFASISDSVRLGKGNAGPGITGFGYGGTSPYYIENDYLGSRVVFCVAFANTDEVYTSPSVSVVWSD